MQTYRHGFLIMGVALLLSACASAGTNAGRGQSSRTGRDVITAEQIYQFTDAYEAINSLRPLWLRPKPLDSFSNPSQVRVYRDGVSQGGAETLRSMHTADIAEIRFYDAVFATQRWGLDHGAGVIFITTGAR